MIEQIDNLLNKLGDWGKLAVLMLDPTGISNWGDVSKELKAFLKAGDLGSAASFSLTALGAVPMFGVFKSFPKLFGLVGKADKAKDAIKLIKKVADLPKSIDLDTYKKLIDPKINIGNFIETLDTEDLAKLQSCLQLSASQYMKAVGGATASPELLAKTQRYEDLLSKIDKELYNKRLDSLYAEGDEVIATPQHLFEVTNAGNVVKGGSSKRLTTKAQTEKADKLKQNKENYLRNNQVVYFNN